MFGHNDDDQQVSGGGKHQDGNTAVNNPITHAQATTDNTTSTTDAAFGAGDTTYTSVSAVPDTDNDEQFVSAPPASVTAPAESAPAVPSSPADQSYSSYNLPGTVAPTTAITPTNDDISSTDAGELLSLKQQALKQLSPLVNQLDQSAEEKFKTTMMMIQASDDRSLLKNAYETAQEIPDEKARAQALLDVVNEINYFTQAN